MVGVSVAVHLARRGRSVVLVDRRGPGEETSQGNAGLIQQEGVLLMPSAEPRQDRLVRLNASRDMRYHLLDLPRFAPYLVRYWWASRPQAYHRMVRTYAKLIAHAVPEHAALVELAGAHDLIVKNGWIAAYRTASALDEPVAEAQWLEKEFGVRHAAFDGSALQRLEPALKSEVAGAVHWLDPWTVRSPLQLTQAYFGYFTSLGGRFVTGDARTASPRGRQGWSIETEQGALDAREVVIALGPWSTDLTRRLGYDIPLAVQRGYSMHYRLEGGEPLRHWIADREMGYLVAPMLHGIRITTGRRSPIATRPRRLSSCAGRARPERCSAGRPDRSRTLDGCPTVHAGHAAASARRPAMPACGSPSATPTTASRWDRRPDG